jgi:hypothetical protein
VTGHRRQPGRGNCQKPLQGSPNTLSFFVVQNCLTKLGIFLKINANPTRRLSPNQCLEGFIFIL